MTRSIALITGDLHLMKHAWVNRKTLCGDAEFGLWQLVRIARRCGVPMIMAGDQFNTTSPDRSMMIRMAELLAEVEGCYIQGNHDKVYPSWLKLVARHWSHLEEQPIDLGSGAPDECLGTSWTLESHPLFDHDKTWHAYGLDYLPSKELLADRLSVLEDAITADEGIANLLVLHQAAVPWMPSFACQLFDGMIPACFDMVVAGHVHDPQVATVRTKDGRAIPILSLGGVHLLDVTENPQKKAWLLQADGSLRSVPLLSRLRYEIDLRGLTESERHEKTQHLKTILAAATSVPKVIETPIVYAVCDDGNDLRKVLEAELGDLAYVFVKKDSVRLLEGIDVARLEDIDVRRHAEEGFNHAREVIHQYEPDEDVQRIIDTILVSEVDAALYTSLKTDFQEKHRHAQNQPSYAGKLLPA